VFAEDSTYPVLCPFMGFYKQEKIQILLIMERSDQR
jgi:hypothetical protein